MGFHTCYTTVYRGETEENFCYGGLVPMPDWCSYFNTAGGNATGAYIGNVDDYYPEDAALYDKIHEETLTLKNAQGMNHYICVHHWFNDMDYYPNEPTWKDHMMAATLTIKKNGIKLEGNWSHPVDINTPTHVTENGKQTPNQDYQGIFCLTVSCSDLCNCSVYDYQAYSNRTYYAEETVV